MTVLQSSRLTPAENALASQTSFDRANSDHDDGPFQERCVALMTSENQHDLEYKKTEWRPRYLQHHCLWSSSILCVSLTIAVELLFWYSKKNHGLAKSDNSLHYLWTYGPTAILTAIGAIWTRIDYQAKMTAPWNRLTQGPAGAAKTLMLDYFSPLPPVSVVNATRNGDFGVAAAGTITLLWSLIIALSASLIDLTPTDNHQTSVPVDVTTRFKNDSMWLQAARSLSYYNMLGLQEANLTFPDGVSDGYCYERFAGRNIPSTTELHATVDGFSANLVCEESSYHVYPVSGTGPELYPYLNYTMATSDCEITSGWHGPSYKIETETYYSRFGTGSCRNSSDPDDQRITVTFASLKFGGVAEGLAPSDWPHTGADIAKSVSLLCRPTYSVRKIDVVKNGTDILSITPSLTPGPRTLGNIHAWDITRALLDSNNNSLTYSYSNSPSYKSQIFNAFDTAIDVDLNMYLVLGQLSRAPPSSTAILNASFLQDLVIRYYQTYTSFIANDLLIETVSTKSTGKAVMYQERLIVNGTATHAMAAILAVAALLFGVIVMTMPKVSVLACAPSSIFGVARLASHNDTLIHCLKGLGRSDSKTLAARLNGCSYMTTVQDGHPFHQAHFEITATDNLSQETVTELKNAPSINPALLQLWSRAGISFVVLGIIIALETTLRTSQRNHSIGVIPESPSYLNYSWTTVPTLLFTATGLIYGSIDSSMRKLTPYINLRRGSTFRGSLGLDLLDLGVPRMLVREIRTKSFASLSGTLAALIASLLAIFSSSLFVLINFPLASTVQLQVESSISNNSWATKSTIDPILIPSLILASNLSYPKFTYNNLVFPTLNLDFNSTINHGLVLNATIPAVRPKMDCSLHNGSSIAVGVFNHGLNINITETSCSPPSVLRLSKFGLESYDLGVVLGKGIIAGAANGYCASGHNLIQNQPYDVVYFWADIGKAPGPTVVSVSALVCNQFVEIVEVFASFIGADLTIDPGNPPVPNEPTAYNTTVVLTNGYDSYGSLPNGRSGMLDEFFSTLIASRYAIPYQYLRDESKSEIVKDAIIFQHSIIQSQTIDIGARVPPETTNTFAKGIAKNDAISYLANVTEAIGQVRVVQDVASTRILQALLATILGLSLVSWALMPQTRILPREPTSIASIMALLADGNIFGLLPTESQVIEEKDLDYLFSGMTFKMGCVKFVSLEEEERGSESEEKFSIFGVYLMEWQAIDKAKADLRKI
ncbi:hypothetical protein E0Z10_g621 [Xylaria hypoxylon]|uniref:Uncharacterized protein n=1 Tax=Xylaria hypoxylon TaxID=37992 RepID=A0A4Z0YVR4_9PEZI|nr:hypothetical protein E0Z10_g621 [Xylaria hypoxylon]